MKEKLKQHSFSFIDFVIGIANECFFANGSNASPYDVNFNNHYNALYDFDQVVDPDGSNIPEKVIVDKKTKSIKAEYNNIDLSDVQVQNVKEYCNNNNIDCDIKSNKLQSIVINKTSVGVTDDRKWKKEL